MTLTSILAILLQMRRFAHSAPFRRSGGLVAGFGPGWIYALDAATFLVSAVSLAAIRVDDVRVGARASSVTSWAEIWL